MALKGYLASIKGQSSAVALSLEATTSTDDQFYQITNVARRILDINTPVVVRVGGNIVTTGYKVKYLTGTIEFDTVEVRTVTVSGAYVSLTELAQGKSYSFNGTADMLDKTTFKKAYREFESGLKTGTAEIQLFYLDTYFYDWLMDGSVKVVELYVADAEDPIRFLALVADDSINIPVEGLVDQSISLQITKELGIYA